MITRDNKSLKILIEAKKKVISIHELWCNKFKKQLMSIMQSASRYEWKEEILKEKLRRPASKCSNLLFLFIFLTLPICTKINRERKVFLHDGFFLKLNNFGRISEWKWHEWISFNFLNHKKSSVSKIINFFKA